MIEAPVILKHGRVSILVGDCREMLATLPDRSVQMCCTSPPYFGLRDYGHAGQIGLEPTPDAYVAEMVSVFREVRRVLRDDGTLWLNIGDSYANDGKWGGSSGGKHVAALHGQTGVGRGKKTTGMKPKDLLMIPAMVALALRADGWYLRKDIIWSKPNPMPESIEDRPSSAHEHLFLLAKSASYFYDKTAIEEGAVSDHTSGNGFKREARRSFTNAAGSRESADEWASVGGTRNARDVWTIATQPYSGAHFAVMPSELARRCILAGTSEAGCCASCGAPWTRLVWKGDPDMTRRRACGGDAAGGYTGQSRKGQLAAGVQDASDVKRRILEGMVEKTTAGWDMTCNCPISRPVPCTTLDPFGGAGTVGLVAQQIRRAAILVEINPEYAELARCRISGERHVDHKRQETTEALPLFGEGLLVE